MQAFQVLALLAMVLGSTAALAAEPTDLADPETGPRLLTAPPRRAAPGKPPRSAEADAATYERCMKLARENPAAARELADSWRARGGAHPAEHCQAVALI